MSERDELAKRQADEYRRQLQAIRVQLDELKTIGAPTHLMTSMDWDLCAGLCAATDAIDEIEAAIDWETGWLK